MIGVERCRANHWVSSSPRSICRAMTISKARWPSLRFGTDAGRCDQVGGLLIGEQAVPVVHIPVELFLKRDHPAADALVFLTSGGGGELLGERSQVHARTPAAGSAGSGNCSSLVPVNS